MRLAAYCYTQLQCNWRKTDTFVLLFKEWTFSNRKFQKVIKYMWSTTDFELGGTKQIITSGKDNLVVPWRLGNAERMASWWQCSAARLHWAIISGCGQCDIPKLWYHHQWSSHDFLLGWRFTQYTDSGQITKVKQQGVPRVQSVSSTWCLTA